MKTYRCYYARHPAYGAGSQQAVVLYQRTGEQSGIWPEPYGMLSEPPEVFTIARLPVTHVLVRELNAETFAAVFGAMQVERMSQSEYAQLARQIEISALSHTSMCAGDVVEDVQAQTFFECEPFGWRQME